MKTLRWFALVAIIAIFSFIGCGGDDGNGDEIKTVAQPTASPGTGSYDAAQTVTLECATNGADIYYSLDGATPSAPYSDPITISTSTTLKALAKKSGMNDSTVLTAVYTITIPPKTLTGNISISPTTAFTGEELTATYSGSETVNYQWNKDGTSIGGKTTNKLTPTDAGSYTVTVSLAGYESKTSTAVVVGALPDLSGNITITFERITTGEGVNTVTTGYELTANYSGSETVSYQWNKKGTAIGGKTTDVYTATETGRYTVTVSATSYNSKTSESLVVLLNLFDLLDEGISTLIMGNFTDTEWDGTDENPGIHTKIETALNDAFNSGGNAHKNRFRTVFRAIGYNIEVVKTSEQDEWSKWKATPEDRAARVLFLGFGELDNNLQQTITDVVTVIASGSSTHME